MLRPPIIQISTTFCFSLNVDSHLQIHFRKGTRRSFHWNKRKTLVFFFVFSFVFKSSDVLGSEWISVVFSISSISSIKNKQINSKSIIQIRHLLPLKSNPSHQVPPVGLRVKSHPLVGQITTWPCTNKWYSIPAMMSAEINSNGLTRREHFNCIVAEICLCVLQETGPTLPAAEKEGAKEKKNKQKTNERTSTFSRRPREGVRSGALTTISVLGCWHDCLDSAAPGASSPPWTPACWPSSPDVSPVKRFYQNYSSNFISKRWTNITQINERIIIK